MADLLQPRRAGSQAQGSTLRGLVEGERGRSLRAPWIVLVLLVVGSTALRGFFATRIPTPWINPDEIIYSELGRSLWHSGRFQILGAPTRFYSFVYPAFVGAPLSLRDPELGYRLLQWLQALVMSLAALPVYFWGRSLASRGWALTAAALTLAVPGLAYSGLIMTEVAFYPVLILVALTMARTLESPNLINQGLALAAIALAVATRLQALVLVPAYLTAVGIKVLLDREGPRVVLRHLPALGGLALATGGWSIWQISGAHSAAAVLGAYRSAGETSYNAGEAAKFVAYHVTDVVLLTGVVPAFAVALLFLHTARERERSHGVTSYLAVTVALTLWFTAEVGVFASRLVGTLAERNLFALAPLFFLGLVIWLHRGAHRGRLPTIAVVAGVIALLATLPADALVNTPSLWEAFTLIPFYDIRDRLPHVNLDLLVVGAALPLLALPVVVPRRRLWVIPCSLLAVFAALSVAATRTVTGQATSVETMLLGGSDKGWIDRAAPGQVVFLTGGEANWTAVYENVFWNRRVRRVYTLPGFSIPGPLPQTPVGPEPDGKMVFALARPAPARFVIASNTLTVFGTKLAEPKLAKLVLWRARQPFRLSTWLTGIGIAETSVDGRGDLSVVGSMASDAKLVVYACSGAFKLKLVGGPQPTSVEIRRNARVVRRGRIEPSLGWYATIPAVPMLRPKSRRDRAVGSECDLEILTSQPITLLLELNRG